MEIKHPAVLMCLLLYENDEKEYCFSSIYPIGN
ncbi:uncharacterized protein METZ01_LOCUS8163 [marine metagenome]|uniref:Uncharacterized protein n=1 Tax=marine metagenome TaxID=408172 RepID=A0A381NLV4_9ZZZZ